LLVKDLIENLLKVDPKERYTITQALQHGWFTAGINTLPPLKKSLTMKAPNTVHQTKCFKMKNKF